MRASLPPPTLTSETSPPIAGAGLLSGSEASDAAPTVTIMLRAIDPTELPPPPAYRAPWRVVRSDASHPTLMNDGRETADFVRVFRSDGEPSERAQQWGQVLPSEEIDLCLCTSDPHEAVVTVAWFRPVDGLEYVWRFMV